MQSLRTEKAPDQMTDAAQFIKAKLMNPSAISAKAAVATSIKRSNYHRLLDLMYFNAGEQWS
jgi:hypothetical protein